MKLVHLILEDKKLAVRGSRRCLILFFISKWIRRGYLSDCALYLEKKHLSADQALFNFAFVAGRYSYEWKRNWGESRNGL